MVGLRGGRHEAAPAQAQQVVVAHQPQHPLVIDCPALALEQLQQAAIAVVPVLQGEVLEPVAQFRLFAARRHGPPVAVIAGPVDLGQRAHPVHAQAALRLRHCLDEGVDAGAPDLWVVRRTVSKCRKACLKKSSSSCCWPTLRSSAAMRPRAAARAALPPPGPSACAVADDVEASGCAASPAAAAAGETGVTGSGSPSGSGAITGGGVLRGRPRRRKPSGPPRFQASHQRYSNVRLIPKSRLSSLTFVPPSSWAIIFSLNAGSLSRPLPRDIQLPS
jgi:hypothetical protein